MQKDSYKTITKPSEEILFKDKNSKFYGYAFPIANEQDAKHIIKLLKKQHHQARHWCYAYQIGTDSIRYRANDDGEPNNSAGAPIYGQILSYNLTNILIVVVRYFGGVKLGVSGLINAYRTGAKMALAISDIEEKTITINYLITCDYDIMNKVMRIIKEKNLNVTNQILELNCKITISVRKNNAISIFNILKSIYKVTITKI